MPPSRATDETRQAAVQNPGGKPAESHKRVTTPGWLYLTARTAQGTWGPSALA